MSRFYEGNSIRLKSSSSSAKAEKRKRARTILRLRRALNAVPHSRVITSERDDDNDDSGNHFPIAGQTSPVSGPSAQ